MKLECVLNELRRQIPLLCTKCATPRNPARPSPALPKYMKVWHHSWHSEGEYMRCDAGWLHNLIAELEDEGVEP